MHFRIRLFKQVLLSTINLYLISKSYQSMNQKKKKFGCLLRKPIYILQVLKNYESGPRRSRQVSASVRHGNSSDTQNIL